MILRKEKVTSKFIKIDLESTFENYTIYLPIYDLPENRLPENFQFPLKLQTHFKLKKHGVHIQYCQSISAQLLNKSAHSKQFSRLVFPWSRGLGK